MANTSEDPFATTKELQARVRLLEARIAELEDLLSHRVKELDGIRRQSVRTLHDRLNKLEERHDKLRDHTADYPEPLWPVVDVFRALGIAIIFLVAAVAFLRH